MLNDHEDHLSGAGKEVMLVPGGLLEIRCGDSSVWRRRDPSPAFKAAPVYTPKTVENTKL